MPFFVQGFNPDRMEPGGGAEGHVASSHTKALLRKRRARPSGGKEHQPQGGRACALPGQLPEALGLSLSSGTNTCSERNKALQLTWMLPSAELHLSVFPAFSPCSPDASHSFFPSLLVVPLLPTLQKLRILFSSCSKHIPST